MNNEKVLVILNNYYKKYKRNIEDVKICTDKDLDEINNFFIKTDFNIQTLQFLIYR